jgi:hypothetical protein
MEVDFFQVGKICCVLYQTVGGVFLVFLQKKSKFDKPLEI